jgi:hypothetical protein
MATRETCVAWFEMLLLDSSSLGRWSTGARRSSSDGRNLRT